MIHWYERAFKLINPKLYVSPYNKNVIQVYNSLKNFSFISKISFWKNLNQLRGIEKMNDEDQYRFPNASGLYGANTIFLLDERDEDTVVHELFHHFGKVRSWNAIDEGITEYLKMRALRTSNVEKSHSYKESVFVIQMLVYFFGEKWLNEYFVGHDAIGGIGKRFFFLYSNKFSFSIIKIFNLLNTIFKRNNSMEQIIRYFVLSDIAPEFLRDDANFLKFLHLNSLELIEDSFYTQASNLQKNYPKEMKWDIFDCFNYIKYGNFSEAKREILEEVYEAFRVAQQLFLKDILEIFLDIANKKGISKGEFIEDVFLLDFCSYLGVKLSDSIYELLKENKKKR